MPFRDTIQDYRQSAARRFEDAQELLQSPTRDVQRSDADRRHLRGAMYLAGYGVECLTKAYLIRHMDAQTLAGAVDKLNQRHHDRGLLPVENIARSAAGHKILYLSQLTDLPTYAGYDAKLWSRVARWQSSWRYETDQVSPVEANAFLQDVQAVMDWLAPIITGG